MDDLDCLDHLIWDAIAPQRSVQVRFREPKQGVGQCDWYQDASIEERAESGHESTSVALASTLRPRCSQAPRRTARLRRPAR